MQILDLSHVFFSSLHTEAVLSQGDMDEGLFRHIVWNIIRNQNLKWRADYGELVIATDGNRYWRREYFPYYKANRKKSRDDSDMNWEQIFQIFDTIKQEFVDFSPYRVIQIPEAEADDIIATFAMHPMTQQGGLFEEEEPLLILSGDKDFIQLQAGRPWIRQYNPVLKKTLTSSNPHRFKFEHIVRGDSGDGIPNILSDDDTFVADKRQKPIRQTRLDEWYQAGEAAFTTTQLQRGWDRNKMLIDLEMVPEEIQKKTLAAYNEQSPDKSKLLNFFVEKKMKLMLEAINDF
jgi:hypothetical protein